MEKIESSGVPEDRDVSKTSKEEFSSAVNRQKGRVSRKLVEKNLYISKEQKKSWNEEGYILLKGFCSEEFCDELNQEVFELLLWLHHSNVYAHL